MKKLFYILLVCGLLASCKSDDMEDLLSDRISSIEISTVTATGGDGTSATGQTYIFEYDAMGRLKKVNDKDFYYGTNGRVEFSRIERRAKDEYRDEEYIEHLSYHWDAQGRLKEVYVDLLYQKYNYTTKHPVWEQYEESNEEDVLLATFSYEGLNRKPSSIRYRKMSFDPPSPFVILGKEEEVRYLYEGDNVISTQLDGYLKHAQLGANPDPLISLIPYKKEVSNTYLGNPHYLAKIYAQLGFHPYNLTEVISINSIARSQSSIEIEGDKDINWTPPEGGDINWIDVGQINWKDYEQDETTVDMELGFWDRNTIYSYRFNILELPTEIVGEGNGVMQRTVITYE